MKEGIVDRNGAAWLRIRRHIGNRIEKLRDDLETPGTGEDIRGEIRGLRWLIAEVEPDLPEAPETGQGPY